MLVHHRVTPCIKFTSTHLYTWVERDTVRAVFPPERANAGILRSNQRWPPEKWKKGPFGPFLLQDCRLNTGISHPRARNCDQDGAMQLTFHCWPPKFGKNSSLVTIMVTTFFCGDDQSRLFCHTVCPSRKSLLLKHSTWEKKSIYTLLCLYRIACRIGKLPVGWLCLKSPYNALQTLDHWLRHVHVCLRIVLL